MGTWTLWVDESGDFESAERSVLVAGLLLPSPPNAALLRARVQAAVPGVPWPPHAAHLFRPIWRALAVLRHPECAREAPAAVRDAADRILAAKGRWPDGLAARLEAQAPPARRLDFEALQRADRWLEASDPTRYAALSRVRDDQEAALLAIVGALGGFVVTAWQDRDLPSRPASARYLEVFEGMLERTHQVVGAASVLVTPLERGDVAARALRRFQGTRRSALGALSVLVARPATYADPHPLHVLADFCAHRLIRRLGLRMGWGDLRDEAGLPVEAPAARGAVALPTVAAEGLARELVRSVVDGADPSGPRERARALRPPWNGDQATAWIDAFGGGR